MRKRDQKYFTKQQVKVKTPSFNDKCMLPKIVTSEEKDSVLGKRKMNDPLISNVETQRGPTPSGFKKLEDHDLEFKKNFQIILSANKTINTAGVAEGVEHRYISGMTFESNLGIALWSESKNKDEFDGHPGGFSMYVKIGKTWWNLEDFCEDDTGMLRPTTLSLLEGRSVRLARLKDITPLIGSTPLKLEQQDSELGARMVLAGRGATRVESSSLPFTTGRRTSEEPETVQLEFNESQSCGSSQQPQPHDSRGSSSQESDHSDVIDE